MSEFWMGIPAWLRFLVALAIIGLGIMVVLHGYWRRGSALIGVGLVLVIMSEKSREEKGGYRF